MRGKAFNGGAERQCSVGWTAVLIRNIGGVERAWDSLWSNSYLSPNSLINPSLFESPNISSVAWVYLD